MFIGLYVLCVFIYYCLVTLVIVCAICLTISTAVTLWPLLQGVGRICLKFIFNHPITCFFGLPMRYWQTNRQTDRRIGSHQHLNYNIYIAECSSHTLRISKSIVLNYAFAVIIVRCLNLNWMEDINKDTVWAIDQ